MQNSNIVMEIESFGVEDILCEHSRTKQEKNRRIYS